MIAGEIGNRNWFVHPRLVEAAAWIEASLAQAGYKVRRLGYKVRGKTCHNLEVEIPGRTCPEEIVVIGAHYDSVPGCPAANDNGSGVAALLALARAFAGRRARADHPLRRLRQRRAAILPQFGNGQLRLCTRMPSTRRSGRRDAQPRNDRLLPRRERQPDVSTAVQSLLSFGGKLHRFCRQCQLAARWCGGASPHFAAK